FRDGAAGYGLARLVREVGAIDGVERLRLSSIEVNHVSADLVAALRETPGGTPHLPVPLPSGDGEVLRAMGRPDPLAQYLARLSAASHAACVARWRAGVGTLDTVLVDRPGRGYAGDYTPWFLDAPVGKLVRARATGVSEEGILAVPA